MNIIDKRVTELGTNGLWDVTNEHGNVVFYGTEDELVRWLRSNPQYREVYNQEKA